MTASAAAMSTEDRALSLLGSGVSAEATANALGVSASRISQLLSNTAFADQVAQLRYENLQQHNTRDAAYDSLEDKLLVKLTAAVPLMFRPMEITKALAAINGAKRRGQSAPAQVTNQQNIVTILLPTQVKQKFVTNVSNQVIKAGEQELLTMQSSSLLAQTETNQAQKALIQEDPNNDTQKIQVSDL